MLGSAAPPQPSEAQQAVALIRRRQHHASVGTIPFCCYTFSRTFIANNRFEVKILSPSPSRWKGNTCLDSGQKGAHSGSS